MKQTSMFLAKAAFIRTEGESMWIVLSSGQSTRIVRSLDNLQDVVWEAYKDGRIDINEKRHLLEEITCRRPGIAPYAASIISASIANLAGKIVRT